MAAARGKAERLSVEVNRPSKGKTENQPEGPGSPVPTTHVLGMDLHSRGPRLSGLPLR